jgi:hypothetical protein
MPTSVINFYRRSIECPSLLIANFIDRHLLFFLPKLAGETPTYFFHTYLNSLPWGVEPRPAGCYPGALTTRLETLLLIGRLPLIDD